MSTNHKQRKRRVLEFLIRLGEDENEEDFLSCFDYKEIIRPLVLRDKKRGLSIRFLAKRYEVTVRTIRTILRKGKSKTVSKNDTRKNTSRK